MTNAASSSERTPTVSVVVCTFNRAGLLRRALISLTGLETDGEFTYEVLVIDNASTDTTRSAVEEVAAASPVPVRRVWEPRQGIAFARNRGIDEARGDWIAFFDDDQIADPRWLVELMSMAIRKRARCVGGIVRLELPEGVHRTLSPTCRMLLGATVRLKVARRYSTRVTPGAGNLILHRSVFREVDRFDTSLSGRGEDTDLFRRVHRAGVSAWFTPDAVVHHAIPAERLEDAYLLDLAKRMAGGLAEDEQKTWRRGLYPFVWIARLGQAVFILLPRLALTRLANDTEKLLGARCRLVIASGYLRRGLSLILRKPTLHAAAGPRRGAGELR